MSHDSHCHSCWLLGDPGDRLGPNERAVRVTSTEVQYKWSYRTIDLANDVCSTCNNSNFVIKLSTADQSVTGVSSSAVRFMKCSCLCTLWTAPEAGLHVSKELWRSRLTRSVSVFHANYDGHKKLERHDWTSFPRREQFMFLLSPVRRPLESGAIISLEQCLLERRLAAGASAQKRDLTPRSRTCDTTWCCHFRFVHILFSVLSSGRRQLVNLSLRRFNVFFFFFRTVL